MSNLGKRWKCLKYTEEDWHPSFGPLTYWGDADASMVEVSLLGLQSGWRVRVAGHDDSEIELDVRDFCDAQEAFMELLALFAVNRADVNRVFAKYHLIDLHKRHND